jgi:hypothetical protein
MALFRTDSLVLCYSNIQAAKQWWMDTFDCKPAKIPADWDNPLPSDVALKLPGAGEPTILLSDGAEVQKAGFERQNDHPIIFSDKLRKAHEYLLSKGTPAGPIQEGGERSSSKSGMGRAMSLRSVRSPDAKSELRAPIVRARIGSFGVTYFGRYGNHFSLHSCRCHHRLAYFPRCVPTRAWVS